MLPDKTEVVCSTVDISPTGLRLAADFVPYRGQRVVIYLERVGRLEGIAVRVETGRFAVRLDVSDARRSKLVGTLKEMLAEAVPSSWLQNNGSEVASVPSYPGVTENLPAEDKPDQSSQLTKIDPTRKYLDFI